MDSTLVALKILLLDMARITDHSNIVFFVVDFALHALKSLLEVMILITDHQNIVYLVIFCAVGAIMLSTILSPSIANRKTRKPRTASTKAKVPPKNFARHQSRKTSKANDTPWPEIHASVNNIKFIDLPKTEQERLEFLFYSIPDDYQPKKHGLYVPEVVLTGFGHNGSIGARTALLNMFYRAHVQYASQTLEVAECFDWYTLCEGLTTWSCKVDQK